MCCVFWCKSHNGLERPSPTCPPLRDPSGYKVTPTNTLSNYNCATDFYHIVPRVQLLQMGILHEHYGTEWTYLKILSFGLLKKN